MRLSKKVTSIFIISTIITISIYKISSNVMINQFYKREVARITGISSGAINRFKSEINKNTGKSKGYTSLISASKMLKDEHGLDDAENELGIKEKFQNDKIKYKFTLSSDLKIEKLYFSDEDYQDVERLLNEVKPLVPENEKRFEGIIASEDAPYLVVIERLKYSKNGELPGYFVTIDPVGNEFFRDLSASMNKDLRLATDLDENIITETRYTSSKEEVKVVVNRESIKSYYKIPTIHGQQEYYLEIIEDLVVTNSTKANLDTFTILIVILCLIINLVVYILIERLVVRRIIRINDEVNKIRESKQISDRIKEEIGNDEISILSRDINYMINVLEDSNNVIIENQKKFSDDMKYLAEYDVVTTLLNRYSLYNYMESLKMQNEEFTIYFIDLDNFKNLNDTLGHSTGDEVLCSAASALLSLEDSNITVGRLGGDEFVVIKKGVYDSVEIKEFGEKILKSLNKTFKYKNYTYELRGSIGTSSYPKHAEDIETLLKYADIAMYKSKENGGNCIDEISRDMLEEIIIEGQLKDAVIQKEFVVYYQPIFELGTNRIIGAEALVRWIKEGKVVSPLKFIPIAKKSGDIVDIDCFVLEEACRFCKEWRDKGEENFEVSVNTSYRFLKKTKFVNELKRILEKYDLPASGLKLEITEDEILDEPKYIINILKEIKMLGVKVSLDDFGIGYSSFNHLKMLPIDTIKIDRSLLLKIEEDDKTSAIIGTLIDLSHTLELDVVCEGVEDNRQLSLLESLECDKIQGYYISRPVVKDEFNKIINKYNKKNYDC
ncbi:MAG: EAL domain-containing protein [Clostridium sp.]